MYILFWTFLQLLLKIPFEVIAIPYPEKVDPKKCFIETLN